jgi:hypothetical protein
VTAPGLAEVFDLAVVRGAVAAARPMTLAEIDAEVSAIRAELVRPLQRLAALREAGAHLTAFGPGTAWHEAVERWLGDLGSLRLTGSPLAVAEREHLIWSMREAATPTRAIRDALGVSSYAVNEALRKHDPAPDRVTGADGRSRSARAPRVEVVELPGPAVEEPTWVQLDRALRATGGQGGTRLELAAALGWSEGRVGGALVRLRRKGLAVEGGDRRAANAVWRSV